MKRETQLAALRALCGFWELLESTAPLIGAKTGAHLLAELRRGEGRDHRHVQPLYQAYDLARWVEAESGIEIENAPLYMRQAEQHAKNPAFALPVCLLEKTVIPRKQGRN